jgi:NADH-quinone oxidoreductase subunit H
LRSSAQLISYELPLGLGILGVVLVTGSLQLDAIIAHQAQTGAWNVWNQPLGFVVFCVAAFAEAARLPFDLPEAEQELVGGYHTEYSGVKLMLYMVAEFLHMVVAAFLIVILFLGGWHFWGLTGSGDEITWSVAVLRVIVLLVKVMGMILFFMLARWSWPRFRYDQLMEIGWKVMIPWGMVNLVVVATWIEFGNTFTYGNMATIGWCVLLLTWFITSIADPTRSQNRPRRGVQP